jgi:iron(III) transport system permease protein
MLQSSLKRAGGDLRRLVRDPLLAITVTTVLASLILFILYPLISVVVTSLRSEGRWTTEVFVQVVRNAYLRQAFRNSIMMGSLTAVIGTAIGFLFAFAVTRADVPLKRFLHGVAIIPIVSPPFIGALAIIMLFGNNGFITWTILRIQNFPIYGFIGLMFAQAITFFPVAYMSLRGVLESISPTLEDAALDLGGSRLKVFLRVTLPLAAPGIASAMLVLFVETLADFGNPLILAGSRFPILSVQAYLEITGMYDLPKGAALSLLLLVPSVSAWVLQKYWVSRKRYVTITGKPTTSSVKIVSPLARALIFAGCLFVASFVIMVYAAIIWGAFVSVWGSDNTLTLKHFAYVFSVGFKAVIDTLTIAGISTPISGMLGMVIAFLVVRKTFLGRRFMEFTSMLSFAVPGTVIGIGYILAFNKAPFALTGTLAILLLNFIFRYIPVGIESGVAILRQIDPSIEEAAIDLGADSRKTFSKITLPLILPAYFSGLVFAFVRAMTAISAAIFLVSSRWNLMTIQIMSQTESGRLGAAAAFSVILVALILAAIVLIRALLRARYGRYGGSMLRF